MTPDLNVLANLGIMVLSGIFMGRLMKHLRLPNVTGYLIAGLLLVLLQLPHPAAAEDSDTAKDLVDCIINNENRQI